MSVKQILKTSAAFRKAVDDASRKCFGFLPIVNYRTGNSVFRQRVMGPIFADYHIEDNTKLFKSVAPDYRSTEEDRRIRALERLRRRGKGPPKKGQGKRAAKKK